VLRSWIFRRLCRFKRDGEPTVIPSEGGAFSAGTVEGQAALEKRPYPRESNSQIIGMKRRAMDGAK